MTPGSSPSSDRAPDVTGGDRDAQRELFALPPRVLTPTAPSPEDLEIAQRLPDSIHLGTTSWSYPGWIGLLYAPGTPRAHLSGHGLTAYAKHPLLRTAEIDRTYYEPVPASVLRALAEQVPSDFRFVAKAHEDCVTGRFPLHARYGKKRGEPNPRYLDATYATDAVVGPFVEGLGAKAGPLLFQFPPRDADDAPAFASELHAFLTRLPKGVVYAVELRTPELLTRDYGAALADAGAIHCHNVWSHMPPVAQQARRVPPAARRPILVRWLLREGDDFERARDRYSPFDRLVDEDLVARERVAHLVSLAHAHGVGSFVVIDNKAEGSAPLSVSRLARSIADRCARAEAGADAP
jgi:uncharacterized protein YecE (DUF72 family)